MVTLDDVIGWFSSVPFLGRKVVYATISRSSQRHRCASCKMVEEVVISDIVQSPLAVLSDGGKLKYGQNFSMAAATSATTNAAASPPATPAIKDEFVCPHCNNGRLGVHCYAGDSTNGCKEKLRDRILKLFTLMPDLIQTSIDPNRAKEISVEDIFFVD